MVKGLEKGAAGGGSGALTRCQTAEHVTYTSLQEELEKFRSELSDSLVKSTKSTVDRSFDILQSSINTKVSQLQEEIKSITFDFEEHVKLTTETFKKLNNRIDQLESAALFNSIQQNVKEQRYRAKSFRLHAKKSTSTNSKDALKEIYDFIIVPSFSRALEKKEISAIPDLSACGAYAHPLKARKEGDCPSLLFKFCTRYQHEVFMRHAREVCTSINAARQPGVNPIRVGPDLTSVNRRVMSNLIENTDVGKVRLGSQGIQFTLASTPTKWLNVSNPFASCVADYQKRIVNPLLKIDDE